MKSGLAGSNYFLRSYNGFRIVAFGKFDRKSLDLNEVKSTDTQDIVKEIIDARIYRVRADEAER